MRLTLLGTGDAAQVPVYNCTCAACLRAQIQPAYRRGPCSALLEFGESRWLIDSGLTDLSQRFPPGSLSGILQTHYHADHAQGLLHLRWGKGLRIPVLGPPDPDGLADLYKNPGILDFSQTLQVFEPKDLDGLTLLPVPLMHSKLTYGYVLTKATKRFAYLTDTVGLPEQTIDYLKAKPIDLLVLDCTFAPQANVPRNHNDLTRAVEIIDRVKPTLTVLTHIGHEFDTWLMSNEAALPAKIVIGREGEVFV